MKGRMVRVLAALLCFASQPAVAAEWVQMTGAEISEALTGRVLHYDNATQTFYASGRTLYEFGEPSWGNWRVEGDRYCSQWPPGEVWDCYTMDRRQDGGAMRFVDPFGNASEGRYE